MVGFMIVELREEARAGDKAEAGSARVWYLKSGVQ